MFELFLLISIPATVLLFILMLAASERVTFKKRPPPDYVKPLPDLEPLPNIELDPLAIEINRVWHRYNGWHYVDPYQFNGKIDAINLSTCILNQAIRESYEIESLTDEAISILNRYINS